MFAQYFDKLDARQRRLLVGGGFLLLFALLFTYVLLPPAKIYRQELAALRMLEEAIAQEPEIGQQLENLASEVDALDRELNGDTANLPENQLEAFIVGRLQAVSWRNDVELLSVEPRAGETIQMFMESLFEVELSGDYFDLFEWLGDIREELGFVVIKNYEMRPSEDVAENPELAVRLTIASYRVIES